MGIKTKQIELIKAVLSNDEASTDAELVAYFVSEVKLSRAEAQAWVGRRAEFLNCLMSTT